jgi:hypothetical protein
MLLRDEFSRALFLHTRIKEDGLAFGLGAAPSLLVKNRNGRFSNSPI